MQQQLKMCSCIGEGVELQEKSRNRGGRRWCKHRAQMWKSPNFALKGRIGLFSVADFLSCFFWGGWWWWEAGSHVAQGSLVAEDNLIVLPPPPTGWWCRPVLPCLVPCAVDQAQGFGHARPVLRTPRHICLPATGSFMVCFVFLFILGFESGPHCSPGWPGTVLLLQLPRSWVPACATVFSFHEVLEEQLPPSTWMKMHQPGTKGSLDLTCKPD